MQPEPENPSNVTFKLLRDPNPDQLADAVTRHLRHGWRLCGQAFYAEYGHGVWCQPMIYAPAPPQQQGGNILVPVMGPRLQ